MPATGRHQPVSRMVFVNATGYKVLGFAVWHGGKWYLRRTYLQKLPSARKSAGLTGLVILAIGGAIAVAVRRG
jgi:hypothetical protein